MAVDVKNANAAAGREKMLEAALASIQKSYGKGSIMKLGESLINTVQVDVVSTGSLSLDIATGIGGVPRGRIIEIYGPESSGKTTLAFHIIANAQKVGGVAAFVDVEHAMDPKYVAALGVKVDDLYISQPDAGEEALDIVETLVKTGAIDVVVLDSVAALVTRAELDGAIGDSHVGQQARLMSQALRKITALASKSKTTVIFINQLRDKIGNSYGPSETTTGGRALKFFASMRLDIRRTEAIKIGDSVIGNSVKVKIAKNKMAPPFQVAEFDIIYGEGISHELELLMLGEKYKMIDKAGSWYAYKGTKIGQGSDNARKFIKENPMIAKEIEDALLAMLLPSRANGNGNGKEKDEETAAPSKKERAKKQEASEK
ncbi:MAG: recombinase RecA [Candidatus Wallbacteria bacterium]